MYVGRTFALTMSNWHCHKPAAQHKAKTFYARMTYAQTSRPPGDDNSVPAIAAWTAVCTTLELLWAWEVGYILWPVILMYVPHFTNMLSSLRPIWR